MCHNIISSYDSQPNNKLPSYLSCNLAQCNVPGVVCIDHGKARAVGRQWIVQWLHLPSIIHLIHHKGLCKVWSYIGWGTLYTIKRADIYAQQILLRCYQSWRWCCDLEVLTFLSGSLLQTPYSKSLCPCRPYWLISLAGNSATGTLHYCRWS